MSDDEAFTISDFCRRFRLSRARFYELLDQNQAPPTYKIGCRRYIRVGAALEWQSRLEEEERQKRQPSRQQGRTN